jgi:hypothetical protein
MTCQHTGCRCSDATVERDGKKYCSESCAVQDTSGRREQHCGCGHPACAPGAA